MPVWIDWSVMLLAVAYLVIAITETDGPAGIFAKARELPHVGKLFECPICASLWIALLVTWLYPRIPFLVYALALAGSFVVIGRLWERLSLSKKLQQERERMENAESLMSNLMALSDEEKARAVLQHYLAGLDLSTAVFLGLKDTDAKQEPVEPS